MKTTRYRSKFGTRFGCVMLGVLCALAAEAEVHWDYGGGYVTNSATKLVLKVSVSNTTNLTVSSVTAWDDAKVVDLRLPVRDASGKEYAFVGVGTAFKKNASVVEVHLPDTVQSFSSGAFNACSALKKLTLPSNLEAVPSQFCYNATNLEVVTPFLPATLKTISDTAFWSCKSLKGELYISNSGMTSIGGEAFRNDAGITKVDMTGSSISSIPQWCFSSCGSLTNVIFSKSLTTFPSSKGNTFAACLKMIHFRGDPPNVISNPFPAKDAQAAFYIPRWNSAWTTYLAEGTECTVSDVTADNVVTYRGLFPTGPIPSQKVKLTKVTNAYFVNYWTPEAPTSNTTDPVGIVDAFEVDGVARPASALHDGTRWIPYAAATTAGYVSESSHRFADGETDDLIVPAAAHTARSIRFESYRLWRIPGGTDAAACAPTSWKIWGRVGNETGWSLIDTVTLDESKTWNTSATVSRANAFLDFEVPVAAQQPYSAIRFEPLDSALREDDPTAEKPYGLMAIEYFGEVQSPDPAVSSLVPGVSTWSSLSVTGCLSTAGYDFGTATEVPTARVHAELSADESFSGEVVATAERVMEKDTPAEFAFSGLSGATDYWVRIVATNDFGGSVASLPISVSTTPYPFGVSRVVATPNDAGDVTVSVEVKSLECPALQIEYYSGRSPVSQPDRQGSVQVLEPGTVVLPSFASPAMPAWTMVCVSGTVGDRTYVQTNVVSVGTFWYANSTTSPSVISNANDGMVVNVAVFEDGLRTASLARQNGVIHVDLRAPIYDADGNERHLRKIGTTFKGCYTLESVLLPDTVKFIDDGAFVDARGLKTVQLPTGLESIGLQAFYNLSNLKTVFPLLPEAVTNLSQDCFDGCRSLTGDVRLVNRELKGVLPYQLFRSTKVTSLDLSGSSVTSISQWAFEGTPLTNVVLGACVCDLNAKAFQSASNIRKVTVKGDVFEGLGDAFYTYVASLGLLYEVNYTEATRDYLRTNCTVVPLTAKERAAYAAAYPGERPCRRKVRLPSTAGKWRYLIFSNGPGFSLIVK